MSSVVTGQRGFVGVHGDMHLVFVLERVVAEKGEGLKSQAPLRPTLHLSP